MSCDVMMTVPLQTLSLDRESLHKYNLPSLAIIEGRLHGVTL